MIDSETVAITHYGVNFIIMLFHFKEWTSKNIFFVKDLLKEDGKFLNVQEFSQKYDIRVQF